jgi:hypothetical protein
LISTPHQRRRWHQTAVIACLGESLTKGEVSYDWVSDLQSHPQNASIRFLNLGVGREHTYNALKRVDQAIQCHPNKVVVLIGAGDVNGWVWNELNRDSYGVYIIHVIVVGAIALSLLSVTMPAILKWLILTVAAYLVCNVIVSLYRRAVAGIRAAVSPKS